VGGKEKNHVFLTRGKKREEKRSEKGKRNFHITGDSVAIAFGDVKGKWEIGSGAGKGFKSFLGVH